MLRTAFVSLTAGLVLFAATALADAGAVMWRGQKLHLSGSNVAWQNYGVDFGRVEEWGNYCAYDHATTDSMFSNIVAAGGNCVRWWVFCDGRASPEFSSTNGGTVVGLDPMVQANLDDAIALAEAHGIYLIFCLWDFGMLFDDSTASGRGEHAGGHRNLIADAAARGTFITNALLPILRHPVTNSTYTIATHPQVLAWEIINEPEWGITESGAVDSSIHAPVSLAQMQEFTAVLSGTIHRNANQLVTLGSACLKWNSSTALGAAGNWWADSELTRYDADGALDFYQIHYYGWMNGDSVYWSYSPLFNSTATAFLDKPTVVGEFPANGAGTTWTVRQILDGCYSNGYAGCWSWTYLGNDSNGSWTDSSAAYATFGTNHRNEIRPPSDFDRDGDGVSDIAEYIAGTDSSASNGCLTAALLFGTNNLLQIAFEAEKAEGPGYGGVNRYYAVDRSDSLAPVAWQSVAGYSRIASSNSAVTCSMPATNSAGFFRVRAWLANR